MADKPDDKLSNPIGKPKNTGRFGPGNPGKPKGALNKTTKNAREAIANFVDNNANRLQEWLDQIAAEDGPKAAWNCVMDLIEYHVPKLARTEVVGDNGGPVETRSEITIRLVKPGEEPQKLSQSDSNLR
jgi:hypothetical protein